MAASLALALGVAAVGGMITATSVGTWYQELAKPPLTPPDVVFAPVWTALYVTMAGAAWLVWRRAGWRRGRGPLLLYGLQLALNLSWSLLFFGLRLPGAALIEIVVLWLAIAATMLAFKRIVPLAGWLMLPYLLWVGFAAYLTAGIWALNRAGTL